MDSASWRAPSISPRPSRVDTRSSVSAAASAGEDPAGGAAALSSSRRASRCRVGEFRVSGKAGSSVCTAPTGVPAHSVAGKPPCSGDSTPTGGEARACCCTETSRGETEGSAGNAGAAGAGAGAAGAVLRSGDGITSSGIGWPEA